MYMEQRLKDANHVDVEKGAYSTKMKVKRHERRGELAAQWLKIQRLIVA
jgi:hypothetical protein